jgi:glycosyltransferase involved in cell wall biosynthesis
MAKIMIIAGLGYSLLNFRRELMEEWLIRGHRVIAAAPDSRVKKQITSMGIRYHDIPLKRMDLNFLNDLKLLFSLIILLMKEKPDYLFLYTAKPVIYSSWAAFFFRKIKVFSMITGLGIIFSDSSGKQTFLKRLITIMYRTALKRNEKVFFQNRDDISEFVKLRIVEADKAVQVNGSGVNLDWFQKSELPVKPISFLLIARLIWPKGIMEYVEAARRLKQSYPEVKFRLLGSFGTGRQAVKESDVEQWTSEGIIEYLGRTDDVRPVIAGSSVFVLPTAYREGIPRTILEAMAMGRAVVATDAPGCREAIVEGFNGFLVPVIDSRALAGAMERFILEPRLAEEMGSESRRIAEAKFDVHKVNSVIIGEMGL